MTQEELADKTEVSARTIQRIENGEVDPRAYTLQMIAKALDVDYSIFMAHESEDRQKIQKVNNNFWLGILHFSGVVPVIFPSVIIWNFKKDEITGMTDHYHAVLSFQLVVLGILIGCLWAYWKVNILTPFVGVLIVNALLAIVNTLRVLNGEDYMHPVFNKKKKRKTEK